MTAPAGPDIIRDMSNLRFPPDIDITDTVDLDREWEVATYDYTAELPPLPGTVPLDRRAIIVADDRPEHEPCEAGTPGCCVLHSRCDHGCETW